MSHLFKSRTQQATVAVLAFMLMFAFAFMTATTQARPLEVEESGVEAVVANPTDGTTAQTNPAYSRRLIVQLSSPSLVELAGTTGQGRMANGRLDFQSNFAQAYIAQLETEQAAFVNNLTKALPDASVASYINENGQAIQATYQVVLNAVAIDPGQMDANTARKAIAQLPGVKAVFLDFAHNPDLYASLPLINAPAAWAQLGGRANAGSGVKVASMDGGIHHSAPMFDGTGWQYPDGWPAGGIGDAANNNGKIIASRAYFRPWDPPSAGDENTWPGTQGTSHGVHTGSTAVGDITVADYRGITETVSGVAPGAWIMSYRVFYNSVTNNGSFYNVEGIAAIEDLVTDGADVVNNSWGGGPNSVGGEFDPLDMALINASNAGVFVSMSNGNAGPGLGTGDHPSDEYINVAASTTTGTYGDGSLSVTAPEPISTTLQDLAFAVSSFGAPLDIATTYTYSYVAAVVISPTNATGCASWNNPTLFDGKAVLISRGSCEFGVKVLNAEEAGAAAVVVYNSAAGGNGILSMGPGQVGGSVTIPSVFIGRTNGLNAADWYAIHGNASEITLNTDAFQLGNTPDIIAAFSSRGPGVGNVLKPDIAAPGVNILAQGYGPGTGEDRHLGFGQASGTSMASPHVAGSAALVRSAYPNWSNAAIKSALMSTSRYMYIYNSDGSPAQPLDMGAGRLDLTNVLDPGVILDPPSLSFGQWVTGTTKTIPFTVTNVTTATESYSLTTLYTGGGFSTTTSLPGFTVSPTMISLAPGAEATVWVTFDPAEGQGYGDNQGYVLLDGSVHHAHLPAWARIAPEATGKVLIIDNDASSTLGAPDYSSYYSTTLMNLNIDFDYWDADLHYGGLTTIPDAATLSSYKAVIYFTGDNAFNDGSFSVHTPLTAQDMDALTVYANGGGIVLAMGQDMTNVLNDSFFEDAILGAQDLQDSVTHGDAFTMPLTTTAWTPPAMAGLTVDLSAPGWTDVDLLGSNEVPAVDTPTNGVAHFGYNAASHVLSYDFTIYTTQTITITAAHIHSGTVGVAGPVVFPITIPGAPVVVTDSLNVAGSVSLNMTQTAQLMDGGFYLNVHTTGHPGGEVRGQVDAAINGDGAGNQFYSDEVSADPIDDPNPVPGISFPYTPLFMYDAGFNLENGIVALAHRDQPTLENPGLSYYGRSIYTSFGLEGVNNGLNSAPREVVLGNFLDWAMDEPVAHINWTCDGLTGHFMGDMISGIGDTGYTYRWDFGDGSAYTATSEENAISHTYDAVGTYTVRVEATNRWGNTVIAWATADLSAPCTYEAYIPLVAHP